MLLVLFTSVLLIGVTALIHYEALSALCHRLPALEMPSRSKLPVGVEALNGLLLIGWSASYAYIAMERYWVPKGGQRAHWRLSRRVDVTCEVSCSIQRGRQ